MDGKLRAKVRRVGVTAAVLVLLGATGAFALRTSPDKSHIGMVRTTEIKIQSEISGRLASIDLHPGDQVSAKSIVAELSNPELVASLQEARAAVAAAIASRANVFAGVRQERVAIAARDIDRAQADVTFADEKYRRYAGLVGRGAVSRQNVDDAQAALSSATAALAAARHRYEQARNGPTAEERASAEAKVASAMAALAVLEQRVAKLTLHAPVDGIVRVVVGEIGEVIVPGRTVLVISPADSQWFHFNVREDELDGIDVGAPLSLLTAAGKHVEGRVTRVERLGDFATWRAARAVGDHDLNTFSIRVEPVQIDATLQPGMTVWITRY
jgi:HlyD family secretion protein